MRNTLTLALVLTFCLSLAWLTACGDNKDPATSKTPVTSKDVNKDVKDAAETTKTHLDKGKSTYEQGVSAKLESFESKVDELKAMALNMGEDAQAKLSHKIEILQKKKESAYQKLAELNIAVGNARQDAKSRMDMALQELENAYQDAKKEAAEASEGSLAYMQHKREEYQEQTEAQLKEYDQKLDELEAKTGTLEGDAKTVLERQMQTLREKQRAAHDELDKLETATGKAWEDLKSGTEAAMDDLSEAYHDALSHFE